MVCWVAVVCRIPNLNKSALQIQIFPNFHTSIKFHISSLFLIIFLSLPLSFFFFFVHFLSPLVSHFLPLSQPCFSFFLSRYSNSVSILWPFYVFVLARELTKKMAVTSRGRATELQIPKKWKDRETSPERTKVWTEPKLKAQRKVPVVYYLSRNGQLEQPHFMEVPLSSNEGLYLRDVIDRLNLLRGKGMACKYSWSSKRSYKNGFVWHDLSENDFIYPAHGHEYVLKGSELLLDNAFNPNALAIASSRSLIPPPETQNSGEDSDFPVVVRRRNQSWSSIDLQEYKVYKTESVADSAGKAAADASTQTDDKRRRRRALREEKEDREEEVQDERGQREVYQSQSTELSRDEISPPPSDSSPETLESLLKADGRLVLCAANGGNEVGPNRTAEICPSGGRTKASSVLMQLLSCGTISFKDCGATYVKDQGLSLIGQCKARLPRGAGNQEGALAENSNLQRVKLEDKEYFSGSLIETKKQEIPTLKRSSSYNADRSSKLQFAEEEVGARAKCIPRKPKTLPTKKESNIIISSCNNSQGGSKRFEVQQQI